MLNVYQTRAALGRFERNLTAKPQRTFSAAEQATWQEFYHRHQNIMNEHRGLLHECYLQNAEILTRFAHRIPTLHELCEILHPLGWSAQYVHGYHPPWKVFQMLHQQIMPLSASIRPAHEVGFAREPDMIHDIFGHLPSLFHPGYRRLLKEWSTVASAQKISSIDRTLFHLNKTIVQNRAPAHEIEAFKRVAQELAQFKHVRLSPLQIVDKLYFWIFEFGIIEDEGAPKVLGAGLVSSLDELSVIKQRWERRGQPSADHEHQEFRRLSLKTLCQPYSISDSQTGYSVVNQLSDYQDIINGVKSALQTHKTKDFESALAD